MEQEMRGRRQSSRRAVALECTLLSELWDGELQLPASNLSDGGVWIETAVAPEPGEELVVSYAPPGQQQVWAAARVVRVGVYPRASDAEPTCGMGLEFTVSSERHIRLLAQALRGDWRPSPKLAPQPAPTADLGSRAEPHASTAGAEAGAAAG